MKYMEVVSAVRGYLAAHGFQGNAIPLKMGRDGGLAPYKGLNILALNIAALENGLQSSVWGSAGTWRDGAKKLIRKGEKAVGRIVFVGREEPSKEEDGQVEKEQGRKVYKAWSVFNAVQIEGMAINPAPRHSSVSITHEEAHKAFLEVIRAKGETGQALDPAVSTAAIQVAHAFLDMAMGRQVHVTNPVLWGDGMLAVIGVAQDCFAALGIPADQMYAYGVPDLPSVPDQAPVTAAEAQAQDIVPESAPVTSAEIESIAGRKPAAPKRSRKATKEEVLDFLNW